MKEFHSPEHEALARDAVDDSRLLDGEDPSTNMPEDALHWLAVYSELAGFKQAILEEMDGKLPGMRGEAAAEVKSVDIVIIREQMERYKRRITFWDTRARELAAASLEKGQAAFSTGSGK